MNSALKPVIPAAAAAGQTSPAKGNVASANHSTPALAQGTQNSVHVSNNIVVGQNLSAHNNTSPAPLHSVPSMAPVTANMAQMAQNMSHHGNLSHVSQNSATPTVMAASPNKSASTSSPLSLVQDKPPTPSTPNTTPNAPTQPLALTRTPEKKEPDSTGQANGTIESPKSANAPPTLKPLNIEVNKDKQDIAKTSPSTPKPPEKPSCAPSAPQKAEPAPSTAQADGPSQPKVATAHEAPEKSPAKPVELKPAPTADVAPTQSDSKPVPESANDNQAQDKPLATQKDEKPIEAKKDLLPTEAKVEEAKVETPANTTDNKKLEPTPESVAKTASPKKEEAVEKSEKPVTKPEEKKEVEAKKPEPKLPTPKAEKPAPKSTLKLATVTTPVRKRRQASPTKTDGATPAKKATEEVPSTPTDTRTKRNRTQVQLYQSPTPELTMATKLSASAGRSTPTKPNEDKLIVFYKNEFLAVRNAEGGFYVCQAMQNVYRTTRKIKIRWLSQDKSTDTSGETYKPDFYDVTDMECVLTTLSLQRAGGGTFILKAAEHSRATSILQRALTAERAGTADIQLTEEHPDGLDLSLYTDESQLEKKSRRRAAPSEHNTRHSNNTSDSTNTPSPAKKARTTPKRSPKTNTAKTTPPLKTATKNKKSPGTTPVAAPASKTATAVTEKAKTPNKIPAKPTPKKTPAKIVKKETPVVTPSPTRKGRRAAAKEVKASTPVPSTSTGKATRTPRKPPSKK